MTSAFRSVTLSALFLLIPLTAFAQNEIPNIKIGTRISIANQQGFEMTGTLVRIADDGVEISTAAGPRRLAMADLWTISKKDGNSDGFWKGFATGTGFVAFASEGRAFTGGLGLYFMAMNGLVYGGIGWLIDNAVEGREVLYLKPAKSMAVSVSPLVGLGASKRIGVTAAVTWK